MYQIFANSTGNVLREDTVPLKFFNEGQAWDYLEERYTKSGLNLWRVEKI